MASSSSSIFLAAPKLSKIKHVAINLWDCRKPVKQKQDNNWDEEDTEWRHNNKNEEEDAQ